MFLCLVAGFAALAALTIVFAALIGSIGPAVLVAALGFGAIALAAGLAAAILALARGAASATGS